MSQEPLFVSYNITVAAQQQREIYFFPYKMSLLEIFNNGPKDIVVMVNGAGLPNALPVYAQGSRTISASKGTFTRIAFYCSSRGVFDPAIFDPAIFDVGGASITLNATR